MVTSFRLRTAVYTLIMTAPLLILPAEAVSAACSWFPESVVRLEASPYQAVEVNTSVAVIVRAYDCDGNSLQEDVIATVSGVNLLQASGRTPFSLTYTGSNPGSDSVTFRHVCAAWLPCESHYANAKSATTSVDWTPTAASIDANGSVVSVTKSSGNPQGGVAVFECDVSAPGATSVRISSCTAGVNAAPSITVDGPAATTSGAFTTSGPDGYDVCWNVTAVFATGSATTTGCDFAS